MMRKRYTEAQIVIYAWRREYNDERTHSSIGDVTPMEFTQHHQDRSQAARKSTSSVLVQQTGEGQIRFKILTRFANALTP